MVTFVFRDMSDLFYFLHSKSGNGKLVEKNRKLNTEKYGSRT